MNKSAVILTGSFITLLCSCYSYKEISGVPEIEKYEVRKSVQVLKVNTDSSLIFFSKKMPGKLSENHIIGIYQVPLFRLTADSVFYNSKKIKPMIDYVYKNGIRYDAFEENHQVYLYNNTDTVNIPYGELKSVYIKVFSLGRTASLVGGFSAVIIGLGILAMPVSMDFDF